MHNFINFFDTRLKKIIFLFFLDFIFSILLSISIIFIFHYEFFFYAFNNFLYTIFIFFGYPLINLLSKTYNQSHRFFDYSMIKKVLVNILVFSIPLFLMKYFNYKLIAFNFLIFLIYANFTFSILSKFFISTLLNRFKKLDKDRVVIYGTGSFANKFKDQFFDLFEIVAFLNNKEDNLKTYIDNIPVISIKSFFKSDLIINVNRVYVCLDNINPDTKSNLISDFKNYKIHLKFLNNNDILNKDKINLSNFLDIDLNDLRINEEVSIDKKNINNFLKNKSVLITGAAGSIGSEITNQIISEYQISKLYLLDHSEENIFLINKKFNLIENKKVKLILGSINDYSFISSLIKKIKPDVLIHTAAYKHVNIIENSDSNYIQNNILSTLHLYETFSNSVNGNFLFISSDKAVNPLSLMGWSKRICEIFLLKYNHLYQFKNLSIVRFGNVLGSSGSFIPIFIDQIKNGGPITITDKKATRYLMSIKEATNLVLETLTFSKDGDIYLFNMKNPVSIYKIIKNLLNLYGLKEKSKFFKDGDIEILEIGLKKGEKLHEEIIDDINILSSKNNHIFKYESKIDLSQIDLNDEISKLKKLKYSDKLLINEYAVKLEKQIKI